MVILQTLLGTRLFNKKLMLFHFWSLVSFPQHAIGQRSNDPAGHGGVETPITSAEYDAITSIAALHCRTNVLSLARPSSVDAGNGRTA